MHQMKRPYTQHHIHPCNKTEGTHLRIGRARVVREVEGADEHGEEVDGEGHGGVENRADLVHDALALGGEEDLSGGGGMRGLYWSGSLP